MSKISNTKAWLRRANGTLASILPITPSTTPPPNPQVNDLWLDPNGVLPTAQVNFAIQPNEPGFDGPGMWIQTGLGKDGTGVTIWIEDGT